MWAQQLAQTRHGRAPFLRAEVVAVEQDEPIHNTRTGIDTDNGAQGRLGVDELKGLGAHRVETQRRSVRVDFGVSAVDDLSAQVMSFDVTPAFPENSHYVIPDRTSGDWMPTDPEVHVRKATAANGGCDGQWKPVIKMIKKWNDHHDKPIKPSFLIEVMSLDLLDSWGGSYPRELQAWFATAATEIDRSWPDPAGLGHPVSDRLEEEPWLRDGARAALGDAERTCRAALNEDRQGRTGAALDLWETLFGPAFAKS